MASFKWAGLASIHHEGGYTAGKGDYGGETYMGISRRWFPRWAGWEEIDRIKARRPIAHNEMALVDIDLVLDLYKKEFWDKVGGDKIHDQRLAEMVFDHALTVGPRDAVRMVQRSVDVPDDGIAGPKTVAAINAFVTNNREWIRRRIFRERLVYYMNESAKDATQEANLPSWVRRTVKSYSGEV